MSIIKSYQLSGFSFQLTTLVTLVPNLRFGMHTGTSGSKSLIQGLVFIITILFISSTTLFAQTPKFDQLKQRFSGGEVFQASFNHTYTDSYTKETVSSSGKIWIDEKRYKLESDGQTILVDGETSRVYDASRNRVIVDYYEPEDDDFAPSRMLSGIDSSYVVSEKMSGNQIIISLESTDDFSIFVQVEILLSADGRPMKISARDISDNEIITTFTNGRFLKSGQSLFELSYPQDAEVVDMRN